MRQFLVGIGIICGLSISVYGQDFILSSSYFDNYTVRNLTTDDGIPGNQVYFAEEDTNGFVWIVSIDGLTRYDGTKLDHYDQGYRGGSLYEIFPDSKGDYWLAAVGGGVYKFEGDTLQQFRSELNFQNGFVKTIAFDDNDALYIGVYGYGLIKFKDGKVIQTFKPEDGLVSDEIWVVRFDKDGRLWIGTNDGLSILENGSFTNFTTKNGLPYNTIRGLTVMSNGEVWVGTDKEGTIIFEDQEPNRYLYKEQGLNAPFPQYFAEHPFDGSIWIADHGTGIHRYKDGKFENFNTENGLISNLVTFVGFTKDGIAMVGSEVGISFLIPSQFSLINEKTPGVEASVFVNVHTEINGTPWLGGDGSGFRYFQKNKWNSLEYPASITNGYSSTMIADPTGGMWIATQGTGIIHVKNNKIVKHIGAEDGLKDDFARCLAFDNSGNLWVGTNKGINVLDSDYNIINSYDQTNGLSSNFCITIESVSDGSIWFGSYDNGIYKFKNDTIINYNRDTGFLGSRVFAIKELSNGWILTSHSGDGFTIFDGDEITRFGIEYGLKDLYPNGILEDEYQNIWMTTADGIFVVALDAIEKAKSKASDKIPFIRYNKNDGLPTDIMESANSSTVAKTEDGIFLFATSLGVAVIDSKSATMNTDSFFPYINEFFIDGQKTDTSTPIVLSPEKSKIEISYSALNLVSPSKTKFRFKMSGINNEWIEVDTRTSAYYDFLPDGNYTFTVSAIGPDGMWSDKTATVSFIVLPPYYKTWWFRLAILLGFAGTVAFIVQWRNSAKVQTLNRELAYQQKIQKERERISRDLHDNVGSQITNLITGIEISSLHNQSGDQEKVGELLETLDVEARNTMTDLRETIWLLDKEEVPFTAFMEHLRGYINRQKQFLGTMNPVIQSDVKATVLLNPIQSLNLMRIIQEAVNNARKYAQATELSITFTSNETEMLLDITDNGVGMHLEESSLVGNGLTNMKARAQLIDARFSIVSAPDKGTCIQVQLPIYPQ